MASMQIPTRRLGKSGLEVTRLGFGGIPIMAIPEKEAIAVVRRAHDLGIRFFDSGHTYGASEERIGKALEGRDWVAATKTEERSAEAVYQDVKTSLKNLRRDFIALYQFHYLNTEEELEALFAPGGGMEGLRRAREEGKIGHIGVTGHRPEVLAKAVERCEEFVSVQAPFNVVECESLERLIPRCQEREVGVIAMKPVGGGNFSNAALAVKWCLNQAITVAIPGMAAIAEVEENVRVATGEIALTPEEAAACERMKSELDARTCRKCGYCVPCPQGVKTNVLMILPSVIRRVGAENMGSGAYNIIASLEKCEECGTCMTRCPYDLPIPEIMRESAAVAQAMLEEAGIEKP
jgi:aryl-alcohol dehydrogenase-like predicted oxidoreductase